MLQSATEVVGAAVCGKRVVLLKRLYRVAQDIALAALDASDLLHDLIDLLLAPLAGAVQGEGSDIEQVDESSKHAATHRDDVVELVGLIYVRLPLDVVVQRLGDACIDLAARYGAYVTTADGA